MFTKFRRSSSVLFLDSSGLEPKEYDKSKKIRLILSPSLYWVQKLSLPVKYVRDVKKLLPSIFEDILPQGTYSYSAYKSGDEFFVFAYEDKKIVDLLHVNGVNLSDIIGIHFTQSEFQNIQKPIILNDKESLYLKDGVVLLAPTIWFKEVEDLDISKVELSSHSIKIQQYGHIVKSSSLYKIAALLVALISIVAIESFISSQKINRIENAKDELFSKYKLQSTMFQNKSLQSKYKNIYAKQSQLREYISYFLSMHLTKAQKLTLIDYKNSTLRVNISGMTKTNQSNIINTLESKNVKYTKKLQTNVLKLEMKI